MRMGQRKAAAICLVMVLIVGAMPVCASADNQWHYQASTAVAEPGLMEAVLPAGLFFSAGATAPASEVDLSLSGPDGNSRSFELYWKEENSPRTEVLKSAKVLLDNTRALIWAAASPKDLRIEKIRIEFTAPQTMGKVRIEGKDNQGWQVLADGAALYHTEGQSATEIEIKPAVYEQLRLSFKGYDNKFRETPFQVSSVTVSGKSTAKDYIETVIDLHFSDEKQEGKRVISSTLPGSGLWIKNVVLRTEAQFQGTWELGQETIIGGKLQFQELSTGNINTVSKAASRIELPINRTWPGRSLILRLSPAKTYLGKILEMKITANLPRITFYADKAGTYLAQTGTGNTMSIKEAPGDTDRKVNKVISFSAVNENKQWAPEGLAEKFAVAGGPFFEKGYRWRASVKIPESGYYRMVLNREASLWPSPEKVRLVRDNVQVPYFYGSSEEKEIGLEAASSYDQSKNRTSWTVSLPKPSANLKEITLESQGIFDRNAMFELPKQGRAGWQPWKTVRWQNTANDPSVLHVGLAGLPKGITELRITMDHGDNRPIEINKIKGTYTAPALLFLVSKPGEYRVYGGNLETPEPKYDLALVQAHLVDAIPKAAEMGNIEPFQSSGLKHKFLEVFDDKSWGLYAVLGLVTVVLMSLIVRLFPKEKNG